MAIISVKGVSKKYGKVVAVDNVSFEVQEGEIFAFLGPNGAGKSTTIKMLTTILKPSGGEISLAGYDFKSHQDEIRKSFGIVFQDPTLDDDLTAEENMNFHAILYGINREVREKRIKEMLEFVELWDKRKIMVKTFSGGMKRRLEIARGLLHHPRILFLDEPTLGLDPQTRNHMWMYLSELNKKEGMTIFFTTHYMEEAEKIAGKIAIIDHGKIVANGTADELKAKTHTNGLEKAFLALTGSSIRNEEASELDMMRKGRRMHGR